MKAKRIEINNQYIITCVDCVNFMEWEEYGHFLSDCRKGALSENNKRLQICSWFEQEGGDKQ